tara:strand:- start:423 stop:683 length:261 start_codon:yes stop_codon:yes gene_type:complete
MAADFIYEDPNVELSPPKRRINGRLRSIFKLMDKWFVELTDGEIYGCRLDSHNACLRLLVDTGELPPVRLQVSRKLIEDLMHKERL